MTDADISVETNDFDTLGGRLSRARDAKGLPLGDVAKMVGVEKRTLRGWECDRAAPRSNRLAMLAGILGVSPSWLLYGRGTSPVSEPASVEAENIKEQLNHLKNEQQKISEAIENIEKTLSRQV